MCTDLDPGPYLKSQGHLRHLKVKSTHALVCTITYLCIEDCLLDSLVVELASSAGGSGFNPQSRTASYQRHFGGHLAVVAGMKKSPTLKNK